eukprot:12342890-Karenia_brevis.AAC.1
MVPSSPQQDEARAQQMDDAKSLALGKAQLCLDQGNTRAITTKGRTATHLPPDGTQMTTQGAPCGQPRTVA